MALNIFKFILSHFFPLPYQEDVRVLKGHLFGCEGMWRRQTDEVLQVSERQDGKTGNMARPAIRYPSEIPSHSQTASTTTSDNRAIRPRWFEDERIVIKP